MLIVQALKVRIETHLIAIVSIAHSLDWDSATLE
jgi:hypothetical protein